MDKTKPTIKGHKDLDVWKLSMSLAEQIYELTKAFPQSETYGLTSQMKRAAISIPSNIAEGAGRRGDKEFIQFLYIAMGSLSELETQLLLSERLKFAESVKEHLSQVEQIKQMIFGLIRYIKNK